MYQEKIDELKLSKKGGSSFGDIVEKALPIVGKVIGFVAPIFSGLRGPPIKL